MGEVYRAEDTKLGRQVAIKVLPEAVAGDPERLARFEREARVLASLNHPNIAGIHQVEEATGQHLLIMELVEGEDLKERLSRGPIPVDEALPIVLQVAQALEAAHASGVVHRDLKPANVKVTPDGQVKVLDFGLAKALDPSEASGEGSVDNAAGALTLSMSPTLTQQMTGAGVILGTAAYMAPEQARGKSVDARADVWAFGVLMWEILTGQSMFAGETVTDVIAAVGTPTWQRCPRRRLSKRGGCSRDASARIRGDACRMSGQRVWSSRISWRGARKSRRPRQPTCRTPSRRSVGAACVSAGYGPPAPSWRPVWRWPRCF